MKLKFNRIYEYGKHCILDLDRRAIFFFLFNLNSYKKRLNEKTYELWHVISNNVAFDKCRLRWFCAASCEA